MGNAYVAASGMLFLVRVTGASTLQASCIAGKKDSDSRPSSGGGVVGRPGSGSRPESGGRRPESASRDRPPSASSERPTSASSNRPEHAPTSSRSAHIRPPPRPTPRCICTRVTHAREPMCTYKVRCTHISGEAPTAPPRAADRIPWDRSVCDDRAKKKGTSWAAHRARLAEPYKCGAHRTDILSPHHAMPICTIRGLLHTAASPCAHAPA